MEEDQISVEKQITDSIKADDIYHSEGEKPSEVLINGRYHHTIRRVIQIAERLNNNGITYIKEDKEKGIYSNHAGGYYRLPRCEFLLHQVKTVEEQLLTWFKENKCDNGDDYSCYLNEKGRWVVSYTNDYPMQHGSGGTHTFSDDDFFDATNKIRIRDKALRKHYNM